MERQLFVVAKQPVAGHTKTRLCPPLTGEQAAGLYESFLQDTLDVMRGLSGVGCNIAYLAGSASDTGATLAYFHSLAPDMNLMPQRGHDLGQRLDHILGDALCAGAKYAIVMDSDSPTLPGDYLNRAFEALDGSCDVVLGPCDDGGYYLIGMKRPHPRLLREVRMSTSSVLRDTLELAQELQLKVELLPAWYDVDTGLELEHLRTELALSPSTVAVHTRAYLPSLVTVAVS